MRLPWNHHVKLFKIVDGHGVGEPSSNYDSSSTFYNEGFLHQKTILCMFAWHVKACGSCLSRGRLSIWFLSVWQGPLKFLHSALAAHISGTIVVVMWAIKVGAFLVIRLPQKHHVKLQRLINYLMRGPVTWSRNGPHRTIAWVQSSFVAHVIMRAALGFSHPC